MKDTVKGMKDTGFYLPEDTMVCADFILFSPTIPDLIFWRQMALFMLWLYFIAP